MMMMMMMMKMMMMMMMVMMIMMLMMLMMQAMWLLTDDEIPMVTLQKNYEIWNTWKKSGEDWDVSDRIDVPHLTHITDYVFHMHWGMQDRDGWAHERLRAYTSSNVRVNVGVANV